MSSEVESARAMAPGEFRIIGADGPGVGYYETEAESPSSTNPQ
jgi:hypothetical protein